MSSGPSASSAARPAARRRRGARVGLQRDRRVSPASATAARVSSAAAVVAPEADRHVGAEPGEQQAHRASDAAAAAGDQRAPALQCQHGSDANRVSPAVKRPAAGGSARSLAHGAARVCSRGRRRSRARPPLVRGSRRARRPAAARRGAGRRAPRQFVACDQAGSCGPRRRAAGARARGCVRRAPLRTPARGEPAQLSCARQRRRNVARRQEQPAGALLDDRAQVREGRGGDDRPDARVDRGGLQRHRRPERVAQQDRVVPSQRIEGAADVVPLVVAVAASCRRRSARGRGRRTRTPRSRGGAAVSRCPRPTGGCRRLRAGRRGWTAGLSGRNNQPSSCVPALSKRTLSNPTIGRGLVSGRRHGCTTAAAPQSAGTMPKASVASTAANAVRPARVIAARAVPIRRRQGCLPMPDPTQARELAFKGSGCRPAGRGGAATIRGCRSSRSRVSRAAGRPR